MVQRYNGLGIYASFSANGRESRKNEIPAANRPVPPVGWRFSLKLVTKTALGEFPVLELLFPGSDEPVPFGQHFLSGED